MRTGCLPALLAVVALTGAGCGAGDDPVAAPTPTPTAAAPTTPTTVERTTTTVEAPVAVDGLRAAVRRDRLFATRGQLRLDVERVDPGTTSITSFALVSDRFAAVAPDQRAVTLGPGRVVALPLSYGAARCTVDADEAAVVLALDGGSEVRVPLAGKALDELGALHAQACRTEAVAAALDVRLELTGPPTADHSVPGTLHLEQRTPGVRATVDTVQGSTVFTVDAGGAEPPLLEVGPGAPADELALTLTASRCDPHALIEAKNTFTLTLRLALDGGEAAPHRVELTGAPRRLLEELLTACLDT